MKIKCDYGEPCGRCKTRSCPCSYTRKGYIDPYQAYLVPSDDSPRRTDKDNDTPGIPTTVESINRVTGNPLMSPIAVSGALNDFTSSLMRMGTEPSDTEKSLGDNPTCSTFDHNIVAPFSIPGLMNVDPSLNSASTSWTLGQLDQVGLLLDAAYLQTSSFQGIPPFSEKLLPSSFSILSRGSSFEWLGNWEVFSEHCTTRLLLGAVRSGRSEMHFHTITVVMARSRVLGKSSGSFYDERRNPGVSSTLWTTLSVSLPHRTFADTQVSRIVARASPCNGPFRLILLR